jgi:hypothetical protein
MQNVVVLADERPSLLTDISYILSKEGIRMENMCIEAAGGKTAISISVRDGAKAKEVLAKNGFEVVDKNTMVLRVPDYIKKIDYIKNKLAQEKIALKQMKIISCSEDKGLVAVLVDKPRKAFRLLNEFVLSVD